MLTSARPDASASAVPPVGNSYKALLKYENIFEVYWVTSDFPSDDIYLKSLCELYTEIEVVEIKKYLEEWSAGTYATTAQGVLDHAIRKGIEPIKYLRRCHNFNRKRARRVPPKGYRQDGSAVYRKDGQYLIVRLDQFGIEKVVSFGISQE